MTDKKPAKKAAKKKAATCEQVRESIISLQSSFGDEDMAITDGLDAILNQLASVETLIEARQ
ncbi:MAG: hypothetical protein ACPG5W_11595 [Flavobacteriales bacterium]